MLKIHAKRKIQTKDLCFLCVAYSLYATNHNPSKGCVKVADTADHISLYLSVVMYLLDDG